MQSVVRFGNFELRAAEGLLLAQGSPVLLGSRAAAVLRALVARAGELVTKEELLAAAWPGLVVEEANVHVAVSQLRKVLGKAAINTVAGLGYRFALALAEAPAGAAGPARPALPQPRTAFVGRQAEMAAVVAQLHHTRLLTLVAMGGMGKTRLALQLAQHLQASYADGVVFVELQPVQSTGAAPGAVPGAAVAAVVAAVAQAVAQGLALPTPPAAAASSAANTQALLQHLQGRQLLLVLDNCEHLLEAVCTLLLPVLQGAPGVTVLATCRQALELPGEQVFALRPLQLPASVPAPPLSPSTAAGLPPGPAAAAPPANAPAGASAAQPAPAASEAEQLFLQRVWADNPGFAVDSANAALLADICRRLDGIPLALELAAARMKMLSLQQLHSLLAQRFELLSSGGSRGPSAGTSGGSRQQTLHSVLQWSHEHLPAPEQALAQAVALCSGGFELDTAVALAAAVWPRGGEAAGHPNNTVTHSVTSLESGPEASGLATPTRPPTVAVLDSLALLADRALIHVTHGSHTARYGLLETVREYLLAQATASGRLQAVRQHHAAHFHALALQAEAASGPEAAAWAPRLDAERDNLLAALAWCQQHGPAHSALEMVAALKSFWFASGLLEQGLLAAQQALARVQRLAPSALQARVQRLAAQLCLFMARLDEGAVHAHQALATAQALGDEAGAAAALCFAGRIAVKSDDTHSGEQLLLEGLRRARQAQALSVVGEALNALAFAAIERDDLAAAEAHFGAALVNSQQRGSALGSVIETLNLAWVCVTQSAARKTRAPGEDERARQLLLSVWHALQGMPHRYVAQEFIDVCASLALNRSWFEEAALLHAASAAQRQAMALPLTAKQAARRASEAAAARAALGEAAYAQCAATGRVLLHGPTLARVGGWLQTGPLQPAAAAVAGGVAPATPPPAQREPQPGLLLQPRADLHRAGPAAAAPTPNPTPNPAPAPRSGRNPRQPV